MDGAADLMFERMRDVPFNQEWMVGGLRCSLDVANDVFCVIQLDMKTRDDDELRRFLKLQVSGKKKLFLAVIQTCKQLE